MDALSSYFLFLAEREPFDKEEDGQTGNRS